MRTDWNLFDLLDWLDKSRRFRRRGACRQDDGPYSNNINPKGKKINKKNFLPFFSGCVLPVSGRAYTGGDWN